MATYRYYVNGRLQSMNLQPVEDVSVSRGGFIAMPAFGAARPASASGRGGRRTGSAARGLARAYSERPSFQTAEALAISVRRVASSSDRRAREFLGTLDASRIQVGLTTRPHRTAMIPTATLIVGGARSGEIKWLQKQYGFEIEREGLQGKVLLRAPGDGEAAVAKTFQAAKELFERGKVDCAHPNFVRLISRVQPAAGASPRRWNLANDGQPGVPSADVSAYAAWTYTQGSPEIRVAVLDEGVDTLHPALKTAVAAEKDFVDQNAHARPDGDDAHGTSCAGIIFSSDAAYPGLANKTNLVAVRIAKGDGAGHWVFDDYNTADAIDWAWNEGRADVLSNSWGGGPPVDVISQAILRAVSKGRGGKGSLVVFASGNGNAPVSFPGNLPTVLTVGASNEWDERKSPSSKDGENWWGSNFGPELDIVAPGVHIGTTDISGQSGYGASDFVDNFNGTSSATPHVAAAAALVLSVKPSLREAEVRDFLTSGVDRINQTGKRDNMVGEGRLNAYTSVRRARR